MIFKTGTKAFLKLGRSEVRVHLSGLSRQREVSKTFALNEGGEGFSAETLKRLLDSVADWVQENLRTQKTIEVNWILSDPWLHQRIFQVDKLPGSQKATGALVHWRFGQELEEGTDELRVAWQLRSPLGGSGVLFGTALDAKWYEALCQPWLKRRWPVASMVTLLHSLETSPNSLALDESPFTVILTDEYWLTWRSGQNAAPGVRCRWFADDPDNEALLRDIARAVNEEGLGKVRVFGSDNAAGVCRQITLRFAESMAEGGLTVSDLHHGRDATMPASTFAVAAREGGQG